LKQDCTALLTGVRLEKKRAEFGPEFSTPNKSREAKAKEIIEKKDMETEFALFLFGHADVKNDLDVFLKWYDLDDKVEGLLFGKLGEDGFRTYRWVEKSSLSARVGSRVLRRSRLVMRLERRVTRRSALARERTAALRKMERRRLAIRLEGRWKE